MISNAIITSESSLAAALPCLAQSVSTYLIRPASRTLRYRGAPSITNIVPILSTSPQLYLQHRNISFYTTHIHHTHPTSSLGRQFSYIPRILLQQPQLANRETSSDNRRGNIDIQQPQQQRQQQQQPISSYQSSKPATSSSSTAAASASASSSPLSTATFTTTTGPSIPLHSTKPAPDRVASAAPVSASPTSSSGDAAAATATTTAVTTASPSRYERIMTRIKYELNHYWNGTKLLVADFKVAASLIRQVLNGHELNRRERKQLTRTSADLLRLIPFAVIVIVPFMEFALPVLLKLFPNMLPSTYLDHKGEEAKLKKQLAAKIEMARFLQDTTALMAAQLLEKNKSTSQSGADDPTITEERRMTVNNFNELMNKVKRGESVKNEDILAVSGLFDEDLTLENLNHEQLAAMCRLLDIRVFGSDWVLRYKLNQAMDKIRADDRAIEKEGVDSLTLDELREACRARGIHSGQSEEYMRRKLSDWLVLSLHHDVPISLLVLSRAFSSHLADRHLAEDLAVTLKHIPEAVVEEAQHTVVDISGDAAAKLQLITQEAEQSQQEKMKHAAEHPGTRSTQQQQQHHDVVGLTEIKNKLEDIKEDNDEVEHDIDEHVIKATPTAAASTTDLKKATEVPVTAKPAESPAVSVDTVKTGDSEVKKVKIVDRLNDRVELLLNQVQKELQEHETNIQTQNDKNSDNKTQQQMKQ